jgi:hypothetical protein
MAIDLGILGYYEIRILGSSYLGRFCYHSRTPSRKIRTVRVCHRHILPGSPVPTLSKFAFFFFFFFSSSPPSVSLCKVCLGALSDYNLASAPARALYVISSPLSDIQKKLDRILMSLPICLVVPGRLPFFFSFCLPQRLKCE